APPHLHSLVNSRRIWRAVGQQVVPGQKLAGFGLNRLAHRLEPRGSTVLGLVEIDHRGPAALAPAFGVDEKVVAAGVERVRMRPELLPGSIALSLERLAVSGRQAKQVADLALDLGDERVRGVEVARLAGAEI